MNRSGDLKYVRAWHGSSVIGDGNEVNGITLAGVGTGTLVDHCHVACDLDDRVEMCGGKGGVKFLSFLSVLVVGDDSINTN